MADFRFGGDNIVIVVLGSSSVFMVL